MGRDKELFKKRNQAVEKYFQQLSKRYPHWKYSALVKKVAEKFFLAPSTVEHILCGHGSYKETKEAND